MLQPLRGKILVEVLNDARRTQSGIWLPNINEEVPHRGLVLVIGLPYRDKKGREHPWGFNVDHIVHFKRVWDQNKVRNYILKREQIFAVEHLENAYAIDDYIIIKKSPQEQKSKIFIPDHFDVKVEVQTDIGTVVSVGFNNKMGIEVNDRILYFKNEGLAVRIPLQDELWSLKPRAILAKIPS